MYLEIRYGDHGGRSRPASHASRAFGGLPLGEVQEGAAASSEKNVTNGARAPPYKAAEVVPSGAMGLVCERERR